MLPLAIRPKTEFMLAVATAAGLLLAHPWAAAAAELPRFGEIIVVDAAALADTGNEADNDIAGDGVSTWVAVWRSDDTRDATVGGDQDIVVARSADNGSTWAVAPLASNAAGDSGDDRAPSVATDGKGHWVVVWESDDGLDATLGSDDDLLFVVSSDDGVTWSGPAALNSNAGVDEGNDGDPQIATDGSGTWIVVWDSTDEAGAGLGSDRDILSAVSTDNGQNWSDPLAVHQNAATDQGSDARPRIRMIPEGVAIVVWESSESMGGILGDDFDILLARSNTGGQSWMPVAAMNSNSVGDNRSDRWADIDVDDQGTWIVVWRSDDNLDGQVGYDADILFSRSTDIGTSWSDAAPVNTTAANDWGVNDTRPRAAAGDDGRWTVVWKSDGPFDQSLGTDFDVVYSASTDGGLSWTAPTALDPGQTDDTGQDMAPVVASGIGVAWIALWSTTDNPVAVGDDRDIVMAAPVNACRSSLRSTCRGSVQHTSAILTVRDHASKDKKDYVAWKLFRGEATETADWASPSDSTDYTLCLYQGGELAGYVIAPAEDGSCGRRSCWKGNNKGYKYSDRTLLPAGMQRIKLKAGADGKTVVALRAKGEPLDMAGLPLTVPIDIQLVESSAGRCWASTFSSVLMNSSSKLKAKAD